MQTATELFHDEHAMSADGNPQVRIDPEDNGLYAVSMPDVSGVWRKVCLSASRESAQESADFYLGWLRVNGGQDNGK
jgi:hypothetical protein